VITAAQSGTARGHSAQRDRERFGPFHDRGWDAPAQLGAMDEEGIDVGVIYPTRGLFAQGIDGMEPKLAAAIARAYNNWLCDFCATDPARLIGAGMISPFDVDDAVAGTRSSPAGSPPHSRPTTGRSS
jgi:predicted TIM-barrel fold metal-dependent hydrolase